jgi:DNA replication protein DnaC
MIAELDRQIQDPDITTLRFEDRLGLLVDAEWLARSNRQLQRRLAASPENIDWQAPRELPTSALRALFPSRWVSAHQTVLITGPTGVGKSYLLCALGHAACQHNFRVGYFRLTRLFGDAMLARADGTWLRWLQRLARYDLLLLDDFGLEPFTPDQSRDLLEIVDDRYQVKATAIASQTPLDHWHSLFHDPTVADAVLDRIVHQAHRLALQGESMRKVLSNPE